jgi:hypothetical protein
VAQDAAAAFRHQDALSIKHEIVFGANFRWLSRSRTYASPMFWRKARYRAAWL